MHWYFLILTPLRWWVCRLQGVLTNVSSSHIALFSDGFFQWEIIALSLYLTLFYTILFIYLLFGGYRVQWYSMYWCGLDLWYFSWSFIMHWYFLLWLHFGGGFVYCKECLPTLPGSSHIALFSDRFVRWEIIASSLYLTLFCTILFILFIYLPVGGKRVQWISMYWCGLDLRYFSRSFIMHRYCIFWLRFGGFLSIVRSTYQRYLAPVKLLFSLMDLSNEKLLHQRCIWLYFVLFCSYIYSSEHIVSSDIRCIDVV